ncbi:fructose-bisphosphate aldolase [archaeon CG10_big_fil_rev_8_21_14_0_10_43_11]|nr:MAG: fructose-bisphosphate aldolase [archaeon CG10_big_fil_rev_8_21_14_0_10_43_11]
MDIGEKTRLSRLVKNNRSLFLAMDQGIEHGPRDFNAQNIDPDYVLKIATKGYTGIILHKGVVLKYFEEYAGKVPLILKLNGKTSIPADDKDIMSSQITSVKDAVRLGADAVGFTIYVGVEEEPLMLKQFGQAEEEARDYGLPIIAWMYPRAKNKSNPKVIRYAARLGMEIGADMVKIHYPTLSGLSSVTRVAPHTRVLFAGGEKKSDQHVLAMARAVVDAGAGGMAIGRNVWQHKTPDKISRALQAIIFKDKSVEEARMLLK